MKCNVLLLTILLCALALQSCIKAAKDHTPDPALPSTGEAGTTANALQEKALKIAVVSDIHYTDPGLFTNNGISGAAFQQYLDSDPKLLAYSDAIFRQVIGELKAERPDILLVPGDLTKDGEKMCHQSVARLLGELQAGGTKVYVVPGNHDINNPEARRYDGDGAYPTPVIKPGEFGALYSKFGYGEALDRDPNSLSYVAQPYPGLWILGIDASKYEDNTTIAIVGGRIKPATLNWLQEKLAQAAQQNITVLALMHHNLIEHYQGQSVMDPGYVIDDWQATTHALMNSGLRVIFTGHYHANDVTTYEHDGKELIDIETGSLVTAPSPYRIVMMKNKTFDISTHTVKSIAASLLGGMDFPSYSRLFMGEHLDRYFSNLFTQPPYSAPPALAASVSPLFRNAIMAHFAGDEKSSPANRKADAQVSEASPELGAMLKSLWTDLGPKDNKTPVSFRD